MWFIHGLEGKESSDDVTEWAFQSKLPAEWQDGT